MNKNIWNPTQEQLDIMKEDAYLVDSGILDRELEASKKRYQEKYKGTDLELNW